MFLLLSFVCLLYPAAAALPRKRRAVGAVGLLAVDLRAVALGLEEAGSEQVGAAYTAATTKPKERGAVDAGAG